MSEMRLAQSVMEDYKIAKVFCVRNGFKGVYWYRVHTAKQYTKEKMLDFCRKHLMHGEFYQLTLVEGIWNYKVFI